MGNKLVVVLFFGMCGLMQLSSDATAYSGVLDCASSKVLSKVVHRFNRAENEYWIRGHKMSSIDGIHSHASGSNYDSTFYREYCHGTAHFQDGRIRKIHFLIEDGAGFAGYGWNVEYCVHGLDPWYYYDGNCRVLDPGKSKP